MSRQSARRWCSHKRGGRLPLLSSRPAVTFLAREHHCPLTGTKLYCLVTEAHVCEQLAQNHYLANAQCPSRSGDLSVTSSSRYCYTTKLHWSSA